MFSLFYHAGRGAYSWVLLPLWGLAQRCRGGGEEVLLDVVAGQVRGGGGRVRREEVAALARLVLPMAPRGVFAPAAAAAAAAAAATPVVAAAPSLPSTSQGGAQGGKSALALEGLESRVDPHSQAAQLAICQLNIATQQAEVRSCFKCYCT